ncbi:hypothetical protein KC726_05520 [Candidatus Woesebacteria bacterium]|nr:hypothetical protein [Candidatus Woesebacteria bacterium]
MAKFTSINYDGSAYIKIVFDDKSYMLVMINDQELYYSDSFHLDTDIPDGDIGGKELTYNGKMYRIANANDYQYILHFYFGKIEDIEGEVTFSDYFPKKGPKDFLSLGWSARTGLRADMNPYPLDISGVSFSA